MEPNQTNPNLRTRIYNLIILDKSGSMSSIRQAAYEGCNEVLNGIRDAAICHAETQEQFVSLLLFDSLSMPYLHKCTPASDATNLQREDYEPCSSTPLLDAMGTSLLELEKEVDKYDDAVGMVTIITDGYENASREFSYPQIWQLVERLKHKGWNFAFMGANQDVNKVCDNLNINIQNAHLFSFCEEGMRDSWRRDREAKERYYTRMEESKRNASGLSKEERMGCYFTMNECNRYFDNAGPDIAGFSRITPRRPLLRQNDVLVFGSQRDEGIHNGGNAAYVMHNLRAIMGHGEGLSGHTYAIPSTEGLRELEAAVLRFTAFACSHPELHFLVTAIGCGNAGFTPEQIAPFFRTAASYNNVSLPQEFWNFLNR